MAHHHHQMTTLLETHNVRLVRRILIGTFTRRRRTRRPHFHMNNEPFKKSRNHCMLDTTQIHWPQRRVTRNALSKRRKYQNRFTMVSPSLQIHQTLTDPTSLVDDGPDNATTGPRKRARGNHNAENASRQWFPWPDKIVSYWALILF